SGLWLEGLRVAGAIGSRKYSQNAAGKWRDFGLRNHSVRVDLAGVRVPDRNTQNPLPLVECRNIGKRDLPLYLSKPLVVAEDKPLVTYERATEGRAELVSNENGLLVVYGFEKAGRVEARIAKKLPRRTVKLVGATPKRRID